MHFRWNERKFSRGEMKITQNGYTEISFLRRPLEAIVNVCHLKSMFVYIHACVYMYVCRCAHTHISMHVCLCVYVGVCIHIQNICVYITHTQIMVRVTSINELLPLNSRNDKIYNHTLLFKYTLQYTFISKYLYSIYIYYVMFTKKKKNQFEQLRYCLKKKKKKKMFLNAQTRERS